MKKNLAKCMRIINFLQVLFSLALIFSATACATPAGSGKGDPDDQTIEQRVIGTWAYDYGYNQDEFTNEEVTFNTDKTFIARYGESDYESGTYKIVNDSVYGLSIEWHFTEYGDKNEKFTSDVTSLYKCTFDNDDTLHLDRFSRDQTKMGGVVQTFNPPRENTYHRIVNGTKELLTSGKWNVVKNSSFWNNYDCSWEFTTDGNMVDYWTDNGIKNEFQGQYEIVQENGKEFLYQKIFMGSETNYEEFWYNFKKLGPNLIHVIAEKHTTCGVEDTNDGNMYFYREVETETFYYHFGNVSYKYMVPKAGSYTLINHPWQLEYMNNRAYGTYEFLGWYDNPSFTGNKVTTVSGSTRDFYGKFNILTHYNSWQNTDGSIGHNYAVDFPVSMVVTMDKNTSVPKPGDTVSVLFEATLSDEIDGWFGMDIIDYTYGWNNIASDGRGIKTSGKKIYEVFNLKIDEKATLTHNIGLYGINIYYNGDACDKIVTFSDWKFTVLDNSKSYNINYKFGDVTFTSKGNGSIDFALPKDGLYFCNWNWNFGESIEILGWYENADFSGNAVETISVGNKADKTYYAKFNPKIRISSWKESDGSENHNYNTTLPVKALLPGKNFIPKAGETITVYFEAKISHDLDGWGGLRLVDNTNGWENIAQDWNNMKTEGNKLSKTFTIKIDENAKLPSIENLCFDFGYDKGAYDGIITFSDWKFEVIE